VGKRQLLKRPFGRFTQLTPGFFADAFFADAFSADSSAESQKKANQSKKAITTWVAFAVLPFYFTADSYPLSPNIN
jgi:hypothetical protein